MQARFSHFFAGLSRERNLRFLSRPHVLLLVSVVHVCRHNMEIKNKTTGATIGSVAADCSFCCTCYPSFTVSDPSGKDLYLIQKDVNCCAGCCGNSCNCCCCNCQIPEGYAIKGLGAALNTPGGLIRREAEKRAASTQEDTFKVHFPSGTDEDHRVLMVAAAMTIDYTLYDEAISDSPPNTTK